ncbi:MAG: hypothetical protein JWP59_2280 [Massilia sp.]|nr:hypothetical protein [Massilia sp.]
MTIILSPRCTAALLALCLSACRTPSLQLETAGSRAVRATLASQVAHPEAVRNTNPVNGIDGASAVHLQQKYEKSFGKQGADSDTTLVQRR